MGVVADTRDVHLKSEPRPQVYMPLLQSANYSIHIFVRTGSDPLAMAPELVNPEELSQMHGPYVPGLSAIPGVNEGVYRWRQINQGRLSLIELDALDPKVLTLHRLLIRRTS